ncbi:MAG: hypothetical protein ACLQVD_16270, partial [Capsulimonadaceae bacterium]
PRKLFLHNEIQFKTEFRNSLSACGEGRGGVEFTAPNQFIPINPSGLRRIPMAIAGQSDDQHSVMRLFLNHPHHFIIYITVQDKFEGDQLASARVGFDAGTNRAGNRK